MTSSPTRDGRLHARLRSLLTLRRAGSAGARTAPRWRPRAGRGVGRGLSRRVLSSVGLTTAGRQPASGSGRPTVKCNRVRCAAPGLQDVEQRRGRRLVRRPRPAAPSSPRCSQAAGVATRPRGVRARKPSRTRNGSATSSTVSRSSPTATASVESPTGPPPNRRQRASSTARSSRSRPELVDLVEVEGGVGDVAGDDAVGAHLGVVADPAQQPVGDPRGAARPGGDLGGAVGGRASTPSSPAERCTIVSSSCGLVELQVGGEAEPVAQRAGQQPGPGGGADQGERRDLERDRGGAGALADDDVDPEVLHRQVEHLLGGPRHPVDLVDEEHLALVEAGQDRGEVAGVVDRRAAGDPQRRAHLGGDDHRQGGLAEARAGRRAARGRGPGRGGGPPRAPGRAARAPAAGRRTRRACAGAAPPRRRARRPRPRRRSASAR